MKALNALNRVSLAAKSGALYISLMSYSGSSALCCLLSTVVLCRTDDSVFVLVGRGQLLDWRLFLCHNPACQDRSRCDDNDRGFVLVLERKVRWLGKRKIDSLAPRLNKHQLCNCPFCGDEGEHFVITVRVNGPSADNI